MFNKNLQWNWITVVLKWSNQNKLDQFSIVETENFVEDRVFRRFINSSQVKGPFYLYLINWSSNPSFNSTHQVVRRILSVFPPQMTTTVFNCRLKLHLVIPSPTILREFNTLLHQNVTNIGLIKHFRTFGGVEPKRVGSPFNQVKCSVEISKPSWTTLGTYLLRALSFGSGRLHTLVNSHGRTCNSISYSIMSCT